MTASLVIVGQISVRIGIESLVIQILPLSNYSFDSSIYKLAKSKTIPFPSLAHHIDKWFYLIHSYVWDISQVSSNPKYICYFNKDCQDPFD